MNLDKARDYGFVFGLSGVAFEQDGKYFRPDGYEYGENPVIETKSEKIVSIVSEIIIDEILKVAQNTPPGCFVEVGVYKGGSAQHLAKLAEEQKRKIYLYDTFTGIPYKDEIDSHNVGDFSDTSFEEVRDAIPYAKVAKGVFPDSAVKMGKIAFAHIDCDQYRSIIESVNYLKPKMVQGGVMWFDDYGCLEGATKAVYELFGDNIEIVNGKAKVTF